MNGIRLENYSVTYDQHRVLNVKSLTFNDATSHAIIGPSGCGKTTLLYALSNLLTNHATIDGLLENPYVKETSLVFQDYGLFPWKSVYENITLPLKLKHNLTAEREAEALRLLKWFGLESHMHAYPHTLSGGQKQRVALTRAWLTDSALLLLDEPFSALDAITREKLQDELKRLLFEMPKIAIMVTHSIEEAVFLGSKIIVLNHQGEIHRIFENPDYALASLRESEDFYKLCIAIRQALKEA